MRKFYIEKNGQQSGALTLDQLIENGVTRETMVWTEGMANWDKAGNVADVQSIFTSIPPPLYTAVPPPINIASHVERSSFLGANRSKILMLSTAIVFVLVLVYSFGSKSSSDMEIQTFENSAIIQQQQQQLEEQNAKIAKQEAIERVRAQKEKQNKINDLQIEVYNTQRQIEQAKSDLNNATAFKLLRSSSERNNDINLANENLSIAEENLRILKAELKKLSK